MLMGGPRYQVLTMDRCGQILCPASAYLLLKLIIYACTGGGGMETSATPSSPSWATGSLLSLRQTGRQADRQAEKWTDRQTGKHM